MVITENFQSRRKCEW